MYVTYAGFCKPKVNCIEWLGLDRRLRNKCNACFWLIPGTEFVTIRDN